MEIEEILVGQRVLTAGDIESRETIVDESWKQLKLRMPNPDGTDDIIEITTLRSSEWLDYFGVTVGSSIYFVLDEMGLEGSAVVVALEPIPRLETGEGRLVLTTVTHKNAFVRTLRFVAESEILQLTGLHRLYSLDRGDWVAAADLLPGEWLRTEFGPRQIESNEAVLGAHQVYNIEVETEHNYLTSQLGVLSHNVKAACGSDAAGEGGHLSKAERDALQDVADRFGTEIDVVGSRAAGKGRAVGTELPVGKGPGTRSDIDVRIDAQRDIDTGGALSGALKDIGGGKLVDVRPRLPGGSHPPTIPIKPKG